MHSHLSEVFTAEDLLGDVVITESASQLVDLSSISSSNHTEGFRNSIHRSALCSAIRVIWRVKCKIEFIIVILEFYYPWVKKVQWASLT